MTLKHKYGIKNNKIIKVYAHKKSKKMKKNKYHILWKTTRKNLPGKTFHGKFYKSKKDANKYLKKTRKRYQKGGQTQMISNLGYDALRDIAFSKKYSQSGGNYTQFKRLVRYDSDLPPK